MPSNSEFGFSILVGDKELPEYTHPEDTSRVLVENVLSTAFTYWTKSSVYSSYSEEFEEQKWPVTPYKIKVSSKPHCPFSLYWVFVDGVKANFLYLSGGKSRVIEGFADSKMKRDKTSREFLFSLPRFAEDENDRITCERSDFIGKIEVSRHNGTRCENPVPSHFFTVDFLQANKKDVKNVTKQKYAMATTRQGKLLKNGKPYSRPSASKDIEDKPALSYRKVHKEICRLQAEYHMSLTLLDWGVCPVPIDWTT